VVRGGAWSLVVALTVAALGAAPSRADTVRVRTELAPARSVLYGQVQLRVEVTHPRWARPSWDPPTFEGLWPERMSTLTERRPSEMRRTVFRRAVFPTRVGTLTIPPSFVRYEGPDGIERTVEAAGTRVRVDPLPEEGRPEGFGGVVGEIELAAELTRPAIARGESTRLVLDVYGEANLWDLEPPALEERAGGELEVFPARPRLHVGEHRDRLSARRTFVWDLVPLREGRIEIPALAVPYFDPASGTYRTARSGELVLEVVLPGATPADRSPSDASDAAWSARAIAAIAALVGLSLGLAAVFLLGWARRGSALLRRPSRPSPRVALEAARAGIGTEGFPELLARALEAGIMARHHLDLRGLTTEEIARRVDDVEAIRLLSTLDRVRFAAEPGAPETLLSAVTRYVEG
jgi:hypothetical protein